MKRIKTFKHFQKRGIDVPADPSEIQLDEMNGGKLRFFSAFYIQREFFFCVLFSSMSSSLFPYLLFSCPQNPFIFNPKFIVKKQKNVT